MYKLSNPPNADPGSQGTAQAQMASWAQNSSDVNSQWTYTSTNTQNSTLASTWGMNMDVTGITNDPAAQLALLQNVMFTRLAVAANEKFMTPQGDFKSGVNLADMSIPM